MQEERGEVLPGGQFDVFITKPCHYCWEFQQRNAAEHIRVQRDLHGEGLFPVEIWTAGERDSGPAAAVQRGNARIGDDNGRVAVP